MWRENFIQAEPDQNEGASTGGSEPLTKFFGNWSSVLSKELPKHSEYVKDCGFSSEEGQIGEG